MDLIDTNIPQFWNEIVEVAKVFYPEFGSEKGESGALRIAHEQTETREAFLDVCELFLGGSNIGEFRLEHKKPSVLSPLLHKRYSKRAAKMAVYYCLKNHTGVKPPWGALTGVRPTRLVYERLEEGMSLDEARKYMIENFDVNEDRAKLLTDTVRAQEGFYSHKADERVIDIYVAVPFCTTRCAYCSFGSEEIGGGGRVEPYLDALFREMRECSAGMEGRYSFRSLYIGGGTPTALDAKALGRLLDTATELFPGILEFTVEAGRPDTIDSEKLKIIKSFGANRISVNPQTFHYETLKRIGRAHTPEQTKIAAELAQKTGLTLNMDLIAGLPGENLDMFLRTLHEVSRIRPENLTVHTLAIKRAAKLRREHDFSRQDTEYDISGMIAAARDYASSSGMIPYYLYRQKYMAGNLENVGYCAAGRQCIYNIDIMEETTSVLAFGAGAISKRVFPGERRIERFANIKDVIMYIERIDDVIKKKSPFFL